MNEFSRSQLAPFPWSELQSFIDAPAGKPYSLARVSTDANGVEKEVVTVGTKQPNGFWKIAGWQMPSSNAECAGFWTVTGELTGWHSMSAGELNRQIAISQALRIVALEDGLRALLRKRPRQYKSDAWTDAEALLEDVRVPIEPN